MARPTTERTLTQRHNQDTRRRQWPRLEVAPPHERPIHTGIPVGGRAITISHLEMRKLESKFLQTASIKINMSCYTV